MGGAAYLIPAPYTGMSSWDAHKRRRPPSSEPGVDYYMPSGTPLGAPARCKVIAVGGSIYPATGRFVLFDDGRRWLRALHLLEWRCKVGDELEAGEIFGLSGASGYGSEFFGEPSRNAAFWRNTGGDHVHMTAFEGRGYPSRWDGRGTVDFHLLTGGQVAGGNGDDDVSAQEVWEYPITRGGKKISTRQELADAKTNTIDIQNRLADVLRGGKRVSIRQEIADTRTASIHIEAQIAALTAAVQSLATSNGADPDAIATIVEKAVADAMSKLTVTLDVVEPVEDVEVDDVDA